MSNLLATHVVDFGPAFTTREIPAGDCIVSITTGGKGPPVLLLHGYAEDARMWKPLAQELASRFTVLAPDLPGIGNSSIPTRDIDMTSAARRIHDAVTSLGHSTVCVVGHDIGLMIAYAYAAMYRSEVKKLALLDAFLPGVPGWRPIYDSPSVWHFRFYGPTPLALVSGREDTYFAFFWNDLAADKNRSIPESDRQGYLASYSRPGRMAAGFAYFQSFPKTAADFEALFTQKLSIPVLAVGGEKSVGVQLAEQAKLLSADSTVIVLKDAGHWIMEESPTETIAAVLHFLDRP